MATRNYFQGLLHSGRPSDAEFHSRFGLKSLRFINRQSFAGWTDQLELPSAEWCDNVAAGVDAPDGFLALDHEAYPNATQAERLDTAAKFATIYHLLKGRRPDLTIGFYGYVAKRDVFRSREGPGDPTYIAWQAENTDMAEMAAVVDMFLPTIYWFYSIPINGAGALDGITEYYRYNLEETRRMATTYGDPNRPIYPYIHWRRTDDAADLDAVAWEGQIDSAFGYGDGCILWGGWGTQGQVAWDETEAYWQTFRNKLPKRVHAGHSSRQKPAMGSWA